MIIVAVVEDNLGVIRAGAVEEYGRSIGSNIWSRFHEDNQAS